MGYRRPLRRIQVYDPIVCPRCRAERPRVRGTKPGKRVRYYECRKASCRHRFKVGIVRREEDP